MFKIRLSVLTAACFLCLSPTGSAAQTDARGLLDRMIDAQGGAERLGAVTTSVAEGRIDLVAQGYKANMKSTNMYPDKSLIVFAFDDGDTITQGFDGEVAWQNYWATGLQILEEASTREMMRDALGFGSLLDPEAHGIDYVYLGRRSADDGEYHVLEQVFADGSKVELFVDVTSFMIHRTATREGSELKETYYSDYRDVGGVTLPHRIASYSDGQKQSVYVGNKITHNVEVDASVFLPPREKHFTREELFADVRELSDLIESTHPAPYHRIGGRISYHRHLQHLLHAIPAGGLARDEFMSFLRPFVAAIGDAHTVIYTEHTVDWSAPGGIPLGLKSVGTTLVVTGAPAPLGEDALGATLVSVEGVPLEVLGARLARLRPIENPSHLMWFLITRYMPSRAYLEELLPEWTSPDRIRVTLRQPSGDLMEAEFSLPTDVTTLIETESRVALPEPDKSGMAFELIGDRDEIALLRIDHMDHYRERSELQNSVGMTGLTDDELRAVPSATAFFRSVAEAMKDANAEALIVDLRANDGGEATMADILTYFLYGKETTRGTRTNTITKVSKAYLDNRDKVTLDTLNHDREVALIEGDYDFSDDHSTGILCRADSMDEGYAKSPTFFEEWSSGAYAEYYRPERVMVLVGPQTFSSGFLMAVRLYKAGAELVGAPPSSAPNSAGNMLQWTLDNSRIVGWVSQSYALNFPDEAAIGNALPVEHPMTLELLTRYGFDPNAEVLFALDLLAGNQEPDG